MSITGITSDSKFLLHIKQIVADAGGVWCGVQESIYPDLPMVMFNSPTTRSTLCVRFNPIDFDSQKLSEEIRTRIEASDAMFIERSISVKVATLQKLQTAISNLAAEVNELLARR